ncbi:eCIS core domain-containing protein, partial [Microscilla marina]
MHKSTHSDQNASAEQQPNQEQMQTNPKPTKHNQGSNSSIRAKQRPIQRKHKIEPPIQTKHTPIQRKQKTIKAKHLPVQRATTHQGLPDQLKNGIEHLSGHTMDDVKVHYNSSKPAQLKANAYAQGNDIHLGPRQEKHLPHEAWHIAQNKEKDIKPTTQTKDGVNINDDPKLEKEADVMGEKALQTGKNNATVPPQKQQSKIKNQEVVMPKYKNDKGQETTHSQDPIAGELITRLIQDKVLYQDFSPKVFKTIELPLVKLMHTLINDPQTTFDYEQIKVALIQERSKPSVKAQKSEKELLIKKTLPEQKTQKQVATTRMKVYNDHDFPVKYAQNNANNNYPTVIKYAAALQNCLNFYLQELYQLYDASDTHRVNKLIGVIEKVMDKNYDDLRLLRVELAMMGEKNTSLGQFFTHIDAQINSLLSTIKNQALPPGKELIKKIPKGVQLTQTYLAPKLKEIKSSRGEMVYDSSNKTTQNNPTVTKEELRHLKKIRERKHVLGFETRKKAPGGQRSLATHVSYLNLKPEEIAELLYHNLYEKRLGKKSRLGSNQAYLDQLIKLLQHRHNTRQIEQTFYTYSQEQQNPIHLREAIVNMYGLPRVGQKGSTSRYLLELLDRQGQVSKVSRLAVPLGLMQGSVSSKITTDEKQVVKIIKTCNLPELHEIWRAYGQRLRANLSPYNYQYIKHFYREQKAANVLVNKKDAGTQDKTDFLTTKDKQLANIIRNYIAGGNRYTGKMNVTEGVVSLKGNRERLIEEVMAWRRKAIAQERLLFEGKPVIRRFVLEPHKGFGLESHTLKLLQYKHTQGIVEASKFAMQKIKHGWNFGDRKAILGILKAGLGNHSTADSKSINSGSSLKKISHDINHSIEQETMDDEALILAFVNLYRQVRIEKKYRWNPFSQRRHYELFAAINKLSDRAKVDFMNYFLPQGKKIDAQLLGNKNKKKQLIEGNTRVSQALASIEQTLKKAKVPQKLRLKILGKLKYGRDAGENYLQLRAYAAGKYSTNWRENKVGYIDERCFQLKTPFSLKKLSQLIQNLDPQELAIAKDDRELHQALIDRFAKVWVYVKSPMGQRDGMKGGTSHRTLAIRKFRSLMKTHFGVTPKMNPKDIVQHNKYIAYYWEHIKTDTTPQGTQKDKLIEERKEQLNQYNSSEANQALSYQKYLHHASKKTGKPTLSNTSQNVLPFSVYMDQVEHWAQKLKVALTDTSDRHKMYNVLMEVWQSGEKLSMDFTNLSVPPQSKKGNQILHKNPYYNPTTKKITHKKNFFLKAVYNYLKYTLDKPLANKLDRFTSYQPQNLLRGMQSRTITRLNEGKLDLVAEVINSAHRWYSHSGAQYKNLVQGSFKALRGKVLLEEWTDFAQHKTTLDDKKKEQGKLKQTLTKARRAHTQAPNDKVKQRQVEKAKKAYQDSFFQDARILPLPRADRLTHIRRIFRNDGHYLDIIKALLLHLAQAAASDQEFIETLHEQGYDHKELTLLPQFYKYLTIAELESLAAGKRINLQYRKLTAKSAVRRDATRGAGKAFFDLQQAVLADSPEVEEKKQAFSVAYSQGEEAYERFLAASNKQKQRIIRLINLVGTLAAIPLTGGMAIGANFLYSAVAFVAFGAKAALTKLIAQTLDVRYSDPLSILGSASWKGITDTSKFFAFGGVAELDSLFKAGGESFAAEYARDLVVQSFVKRLGYSSVDAVKAVVKENPQVFWASLKQNFRLDNIANKALYEFISTAFDSNGIGDIKKAIAPYKPSKEATTTIGQGIASRYALNLDLTIGEEIHNLAQPVFSQLQGWYHQPKASYNLSGGNGVAQDSTSGTNDPRLKISASLMGDVQSSTQHIQQEIGKKTKPKNNIAHLLDLPKYNETVESVCYQVQIEAHAYLKSATNSQGGLGAKIQKLLQLKDQVIGQKDVSLHQSFLEILQKVILGLSILKKMPKKTKSTQPNDSEESFEMSASPQAKSQPSATASKSPVPSATKTNPPKPKSSSGSSQPQVSAYQSQPITSFLDTIAPGWSDPDAIHKNPLLGGNGVMYNQATVDASKGETQLEDYHPQVSPVNALEKHGLQIAPNSGKGAYCLIYSVMMGLLQTTIPDDSKVAQIAKNAGVKGGWITSDSDGAKKVLEEIKKDFKLSKN